MTLFTQLSFPKRVKFGFRSIFWPFRIMVLSGNTTIRVKAPRVTLICLTCNVAIHCRRLWVLGQQRIVLQAKLFPPPPLLIILLYHFSVAPWATKLLHDYNPHSFHLTLLLSPTTISDHTICDIDFLLLFRLNKELMCMKLHFPLRNQKKDGQILVIN